MVRVNNGRSNVANAAARAKTRRAGLIDAPTIATGPGYHWYLNR